MSESKRVLTKKDITNLAIRSSLLQAGFSYERMQAAGWLYAQLPALEKIYKDDKAHGRRPEAEHCPEPAGLQRSAEITFS